MERTLLHRDQVRRPDRGVLRGRIDPRGLFRHSEGQPASVVGAAFPRRDDRCQGAGGFRQRVRVPGSQCGLARLRRRSRAAVPAHGARQSPPSVLVEHRVVDGKHGGGHTALEQVDAGQVGSALVLSDLSKSFGAVKALRRVNLSIRPGELLAVLGPSGSGKTTLLQTVAGYEAPDEGRVMLDGDDVTGLAPEHRDIGMVFQNYALFPHMTVAQNIAFPLEMRKLRAAQIAERVAWALELVALPGYAERLPRQLSGGQQQRVALARAIVFGPRLLLLDEPLGALDRRLRDEMQLELRRLQRRLRLTTLFITHDQDEALTLGDRIAVMREGELEQVATPGELYSTPSSRFVAEFVGESNIVSGRLLEKKSSEGVIDVAGLRLTIRCPDDLAAGALVSVLIRPEVSRLPGGERLRNVLSGTVVERIFIGN